MTLPPASVLAARLQRNPDPEVFALLQTARHRERRREAAARIHAVRRAVRAIRAAERARVQASLYGDRRAEPRARRTA